MYTDAVKAPTCQLWIKRFKNSDSDISETPTSGRRPILNEGLSKETIELDTRQSARDLAQKPNVPCSTVHEYLKRIGKNFQRGNLGSS